jgi:hypothetical protein
MGNTEISDRSNLPGPDAPRAASDEGYEFIDLQGRSGTVYRFRAVSLDRLPNMAGNFVLARSEPGGAKVICCGSSNDLTLANATWRQAATQAQADQLFIYRNTIRRSREEVHADLVAALQPPMTAPELGSL